jgi:hypothetical protein
MILEEYLLVEEGKKQLNQERQDWLHLCYSIEDLEKRSLYAG